MEKLTLPNGLRVLLDWQGHVRTASFGVWVKSGPIYEEKENNGISHLIEHMLFKGTASRSSLQISEEMDAIGGQMNAYTANDFTCFYARTLEEHVGQAFDIVADMVASPRFDPKDLALEKNVVLEEIGMSEDQPEDRVAENLYRNVWKNSPMGFSILGARESLEKLDEGALREYHARCYAPSRMVVAVCGRFDREQFLRLVERRLGALKGPGEEPEKISMPYTRSCCIVPGEQEQTHLCLGLPGLDFLDNRRYALSILNMVMGGSSSSRLFQRIREELGLAYSIYSSASSYQGGGLLEIQTAVSPGTDRTASEEILHVLSGLRKGVTEKDFFRAREQLKSNLVMGMESSSSRAGHMGRSELLKGFVDSEDEVLRQIAGVTLDQVNQVACELLDPGRLSVSVLGPSNQEAYYRAVTNG